MNIKKNIIILIYNVQQTLINRIKGTKMEDICHLECLKNNLVNGNQEKDRSS